MIENNGWWLMALAVLAMAFIALSGLIVGTLLILKTSFGAYTATMAAAHKSNMLAYRGNLDVIDRLEALRRDWKLSDELSAEGHVANFVGDDPTPEERIA